LTDALDGLIDKGSLQSYQAVSKFVPSRSRQELAHRLLGSQVYAPHALLDRVLDKLEFPAAAIERRRAEFAANLEPLQLEQWLQSPSAESLRNLWLGKVGERYASIVALGGIRDVEPLAALKIANVRLVDRVASTSAVLSQYRRIMSWLLTVIYVVAGGVLAVRFGWRAAPRMLLPSAFATLLTVGIFGWIGVSLNLFVLLGLWLVLGLGIDYGIFLKHGQDTLDRKSRATAVLSVTLSACTTLLAFGPLAFSATPFIHSIGLTLLCAIMLSWVLVMFSCLTTSRKTEKVATSSEHG
jgi:predicted exporter